MRWTDWLEATANVASILTAAVAILFYVRVRLRERRDRLRVESYLQKVWKEENGARVPMRIAAELDMPLEQVRIALNASSKIRTIPMVREEGGPVSGLAYVYGRRRNSN